jgi:hypothetical protein
MAKEKAVEEFGGSFRGISVLSLAIRQSSLPEVPFFPPQYFGGQDEFF